MTAASSSYRLAPKHGQRRSLSGAGMNAAMAAPTGCAALYVTCRGAALFLSRGFRHSAICSGPSFATQRVQRLRAIEGGYPVFPPFDALMEILDV